MILIQAVVNGVYLMLHMAIIPYNHVLMCYNTMYLSV